MDSLGSAQAMAAYCSSVNVVGFMALPHHKLADADLWEHQPDQTPRQRLLKRAAIEGLLLGREEYHHPPGIIDGPVAIASLGGNGSAERVLQLAVFKGGINTCLRDGTGEI